MALLKSEKVNGVLKLFVYPQTETERAELFNYCSIGKTTPVKGVVELQDCCRGYHIRFEKSKRSNQNGKK